MTCNAATCRREFPHQIAIERTIGRAIHETIDHTVAGYADETGRTGRKKRKVEIKPFVPLYDSEVPAMKRGIVGPIWDCYQRAEHL